MLRKGPWGRLVGILRRIAQRPQLPFRDRFRQLEGIAKAQAAGKYRGRKPTAMERQAEVRRLAATGMAKARIALELKIGEATVYRILARDREQAHPASSA